MGWHYDVVVRNSDGGITKAQSYYANYHYSNKAPIGQLFPTYDIAIKEASAQWTTDGYEIVEITFKMLVNMNKG